MSEALAVGLIGGWLGPAVHEARRAFERAQDAGMSAKRSLIMGHIASRRDGWFFRSTIAAAVRCSIRTVQRAITEARSLGLLGVARGKKGETPPGADGPIPCGWSHRWTIGWGRAGAEIKRLVAAARLAWITRSTTRKGATLAPRRRSMTPEELDAELARTPRAQ